VSLLTTLTYALLLNTMHIHNNSPVNEFGMLKKTKNAKKLKTVFIQYAGNNITLIDASDVGGKLVAMYTGTGDVV